MTTNEKIKVVTDTMIWYNFAMGSIKIEDAFKCELIVPITVLFEASTNPALWEDELKFKECQKVAKLLILKKQEVTFIKKDPLGYLSAKISSGSQDVEFERYFDNLEFIANHNFNEMLEIPQHELRNIPQSTTNYFNSQSKFYQHAIKRNISKNVFNKTSTLSMTLKLTNAIVNKYASERGIQIERKLEEDDAKLFINVFDYYLKEFSRSHMKMINNDWVDLLNLTYVHCDMKYWTKETKWQKFISEYDQNYLYELNNSIIKYNHE